MQQITYKCTSQQHHGKSAYISKNTVATRQSNCGKSLTPEDIKVTLLHHLFPLASPQQERKGKRTENS